MTGLIDPRQRGPEEAGFTEIVRLIAPSAQVTNTDLLDVDDLVRFSVSRIRTEHSLLVFAKGTSCRPSVSGSADHCGEGR
jgi:hypothetical protein